MSLPAFAHALARCFLIGEQTPDAMEARARLLTVDPIPLVRSLAQTFLEKSGGSVRWRHKQLVTFLLASPSLRRAWVRHPERFALQHANLESPRMQPVAASWHWDVPPIATARALADWLWLDDGELQWFADLASLAYRSLGDRNGAPRLHHYRYTIVRGRSGSVRLIEAPKKRLARIQTDVLRGILEHVPVHPAAHGFVKSRSTVTFAASHTGREAVLRMDLRQFFPSIRRARIQTIFRLLGYPEAVADLLGGLCTNAVPRSVWAQADPALDGTTVQDAAALYANPHLPQGAPTSPLLANISAYRVDCRLSGLASAFGAQYSRYADDLAFSGDGAFVRQIQQFGAYAAAILAEEGFATNHRKTRIMRKGGRQHLAGIVVNDGLHLERGEFDRLKAILTNCVRFGPNTQNRAAHPAFRQHLAGRIAYAAMIDPPKAERLRTIFDRILWPAP